MDHSCQVCAVRWAGRVEAAGEELRCLLSVERPHGDLRAAEKLDCFLREPVEGDGGEVAVVLAAAEDDQDAASQKWLSLGERAQECGVVACRVA
jgi:hypothetical protein